MSTPAALKYAKSDEWIKVDGNIGTVGISDYAQNQLSDVVFVEVRLSPGETGEKGEVFATIESVKAAADINLPVNGKIIAVNESLPDTPELVNSDPYEAAWLVKLEISDPADLADLMSAAEYDAYCQGRGH
jgi:glycine cleavage system H protein